MTPNISVVIPTYNRAQFLPMAIKSILNQTEKNIEIIVMDNASTDNTKSVVAQFADKRIKYYRNKTNLGYPQNLKKGFSNASSNLIFTLSDDDIIVSVDTLGHVIKKMHEHDAGFGELGLMYYDTDYTKPSFLDHIKTEEFYLPPARDILEKTSDWHFGFISGHIFRKDLFDENDLIDDVWWVYFKAIYRSIIKNGCIYFGRHFVVAKTSVVGLIAYIDIKKNNGFYLDTLFAIQREFVSDKKMQKSFQKQRLDIVVQTLPGIRYYTSRFNIIKMVQSILGYRKEYLYELTFWAFFLGALLTPKFVLTILRKRRIERTIQKLQLLTRQIQLKDNLKKSLR